MAFSVSGTVRPSALAVLRLMISSTRLDRPVGRLLSLQNPADVDNRLCEKHQDGLVHSSIAQETAGRRELANSDIDAGPWCEGF